jgi:hypothetical protein
MIRWDAFRLAIAVFLPAGIVFCSWEPWRRLARRLVVVGVALGASVLLAQCDRAICDRNQAWRDFREFVNPDSLKVLSGCKAEPAVRNLKHYDRLQFERNGYFCVDPDSIPESPVFNRTVGLRDSWAKQRGK